MKIKSESSVDQFICLNKKTIEGIIIHPGENEITKEQYSQATKDNWFNWLVKSELFIVSGVVLKKEIEPETPKPQKVRKTKIEVMKKK